jgi:tubulin beta
MGTKFSEVVCDEHRNSRSGGYFCDYDAQLDRANVFYHEASGDKYVPRALLFDLEPGVIGAVSLSNRSASSSA